MPTEIKLPEVGDNIEQGTVVSILVQAGDTIEAGQAVIEIETDKAVVEVPAEAGGTVAEIKVKVGDSVPVGGVILTLGGDATPTQAVPAASPSQGGGDEAMLVESAPVAVPTAVQQPTPQQSAPASQASSGAGQDVVLPDVGDNIEQGIIVSVLVSAGDDITEGQAIMELETDKAVVEVPSSAAGKVASVSVKVGDSVKIGGVLLTLAGETGAGSAAAPAQSAPAPSEQAPTPTQTSADNITDQPNLPPAARTGGAIGSVEPAPGTYNTQTFDGREVVHAAPSVRRLARELGVNIKSVHGAGPAGRISAEDVQQAAKGGGGGGAPVQAAQAQPVAQPVQSAVAAQAPAPQAATAPSATKLPDFAKWGTVRREDMSGIRKATVRSMNASTSIPMVTHFDKADVTRMEEVRKQFGARVEKAGGKLTMTHILMKVVANTLRKFPKFGASLDLDNQQVIYKDYVNLGVAVDTPNGLLVPVLKNADRLSITEMVLELNELAGRARDRKLKPDEMQGATFTISNLGGIGGYAFTPIVNAPEVAILGVSRGGFEPVWNRETESFEPRNMLPLSLSYDHRLIDGADAARFVRAIAESLEDPFLISL
ncbi:dihydrolipoyllysine-residue acetyltransferase [Deinococcus detaillensis]|uniref:Acetyltransferase component of pyruvate dehydrogenase complex n=1 Tax=Deinococcus detaillensis TaxID=2592048 RepID=A0A553USK9_9DEIO|nr:dihydrolipoyllysine-residue acetyltransferase [Deinococcus detaillensis]TSA83155.1 dihydrolipoyllysine-residue acetyltransferase [Deinococcus detaillensis]